MCAVAEEVATNGARGHRRAIAANTYATAETAPSTLRIPSSMSSAARLRAKRLAIDVQGDTATRLAMINEFSACT